MKTGRIIFVAGILVFLTCLATVETAATTSNLANEPWKQEYIDSASGSYVGTHVAIAHHPVTGKAFISYYDAENTALKVAYQVTPGAGNCGPESDWQCDFVDSAYNVGQYSSIDVTYILEYGGYTKIGISYYDETKQRLRYAEGIAGWGSIDWTISNVDDSAYEYEFVGTFSSIKFDWDHHPQIAYHSEVPTLNYGFLKYASYAGPGIGTCLDGGAWDCEFVGHSTTDASYGTYASMDIDIYGNNIIAFYANGDVIRAIHHSPFYPLCDNDYDWACQTIDFSHDVGRYISYHGRHFWEDTDRLVYYDLTVGMIKYAEYVGAGGNCDADGEWSCYVVDIVGKPLGHIGLSLAVDGQGYPIIAYMDASEDMAPKNLKIARPAPAYGLEHGNCGDVPPGHSFQYWQCSFIDTGNAYVDEAGYAAVSVNPAGLATIAYSEFNSYDDESYLKIAGQYITINLPLIAK